MRVVSLVPSWTETLIEAGVNVVGRTRFCIHPESVKDLPIVGGTKNWDFDKIRSLAPDFLILDQEENPKFMAEQQEIPYIASHITHVKDMPSALANLSAALSDSNLQDLATRWKILMAKPSQPLWNYPESIPGLLEWGQKPQQTITKIIYIIWKNPWMAVSRDTFIGSVLEHCGFAGKLLEFPSKYPEIDLADMPDKDSTLLLFSSEPFPFLKQKKDLAQLGFPYAFVDGEKFSWFGVRTLRFLESMQK